jgi:hypothetical protein
MTSYVKDTTMRVTLRVLFLALVGIANVGNAQNVVLVTNNTTAAGDEGLINFLQNYRGYTVTTGLFNALDTTPADAATLNAADLVIVSRNTISGDYGGTANPAELAIWDGLTTPLLMGNGYLTRTGAWNYVNAADQQVDFNGDISAPAGTTEVHPFFEGLSPDLEDLINFPPVSGIAKYDWTNSADISNSAVINGTGQIVGVRNNATTPNIIIATWQSGGTTGSGNPLGSDRVFYALPETFGNFRNSGVPILENILDTMLEPLTDGDVDLNGVVDINDFNLIRDNFGEVTNSRRLGDINRDTVVDLEDYQLWVSAVDPLIAAQASWTSVPEPSSAALIALSVAGVVAARKRRKLLSLAVLLAVLSAFASDANAVQIWGSAMNGNANDSIGTNHGVASGTGTATATTDRHGNAGGAMLFDGASFFQIPNTGAGGSLTSQLTTAGSFSLWVRIDDVAGETGPIALGGSAGGTDQYFSLLNTSGANNGDNNVNGWRVDLDRGGANGTPLQRFGVKSNGLGVDGNGYAPAGSGGVWQHLAATFEVGGQLRLYVNGVLQTATQALTDLTPLTATHPWVIGSERVGSRMMIGAIDDVQIYNTALDQAAISNLAHLIPGDVNNDGVANLDDFSVIRDNFGNTNVFLRRLGDLNQDRVVDHLDFGLWKNSVPPAIAALASWTTVPEPASIALLAMGAFGVLVLQRKHVAKHRLG